MLWSRSDECFERFNEQGKGARKGRGGSWNGLALTRSLRAAEMCDLVKRRSIRLPDEAGYEINGYWVNHEMEDARYFSCWCIDCEYWGIGSGSSMLAGKRWQEPFFPQTRHTSTMEFEELSEIVNDSLKELWQKG